MVDFFLLREVDRKQMIDLPPLDRFAPRMKSLSPPEPSNAVHEGLPCLICPLRSTCVATLTATIRSCEAINAGSNSMSEG